MNPSFTILRAPFRGMGSFLWGFLLFLLGTLSCFSAEYKREIWVNPDGSGDFRTLTESFDAIRAYMDYPVTVHIAPGVYQEKVIVPSWLNNVHFVGASPDSTIITWADHANMVMPNAANLTDFTNSAELTYAPKLGTFRTFTMRVDGDNNTFENLTIENSAPQLGQAVALHTEGDSLRFVNCRFLGNQDTVFTGGRHTTLWFDGCYIEGTTDFIFGPSTAYFTDCDILCKRDSYITAASTPADVEVGYVFDHCQIRALPEVQRMYLGRPWRPYAYTVFIDCDMQAPIVPEGWHNWKDPANELTARYGEYGSTGPYASPDTRVAWSRQLTPDEVAALRHVLKLPVGSSAQK